MASPRTLFDVHRQTNARIEPALRGFREVQVAAYIRERIASGEPWPSYGEIMRELDFYDRAGAYRVVDRVKRKSVI